ncbi:MAG TPA: DUF2852 domain-containing protein [Stellaceae bacterium]|jgi:hypothetical protein|nr:DUF2852 domain-containing protein [Stellaceae bacterium]
MHSLAAHLDDLGRPAWLGLTILSFVVWWPLGLVILGFLIGSGRMACWVDGGGARWQRRIERMQQRMSRMQRTAERWGCGGAARHAAATTGNRAFDEYRAETLRRLEEEQREFLDFLDRLRHAKDKAEFDEFMAERRRRSEGPAAQPQGM